MNTEERAQREIEEAEGALSLARQEGDEGRTIFMTGLLDGLRVMRRVFTQEPFLALGDMVNGAAVYGKGNTLAGTVIDIRKNDIGPRWDTIWIDWNNNTRAAFHRKDIEDRM